MIPAHKIDKMNGDNTHAAPAKMATVNSELINDLGCLKWAAMDMTITDKHDGLMDQAPL